mgnify:FL=1
MYRGKPLYLNEERYDSLAAMASSLPVYYFIFGSVIMELHSVIVNACFFPDTSLQV